MPNIKIKNNVTFINNIPAKTGLYFFKDKKKNIIYLGKSVNIRSRIKNHLQSRDPKTRSFIAESAYLDYRLMENEFDTLIEEANLIKTVKPKYNIQFTDDKYYPYIRLCVNNNYPTLEITHKVLADDCQYFGPYPDSDSLKLIIKAIRRIYPFCTHKKPYKSCLYIHLGLCRYGFADRGVDNRQTITNITGLLSGRRKMLLGILKRKLSQLVKEEKFEEADTTASQIKLLSDIRINQASYTHEPEQVNKSGTLEKLGSLLKKSGLKINNLRRIECYDISNISGTNATASMVVNIDGIMSKREYRRFKIKTVARPDDYAMLSETLMRRLKHKEWSFPDLIMVDGGFGQLSAFISILNGLKLDIPCISLAKREETICLPDKTTCKLDYRDERLKLLQMIRDESHRFAKNYHKLLRSRTMLKK